MKNLLNLLLSTLLIASLNLACSENPGSPVNRQPSDNSAANQDIGEKIELMSLTYEGTDPFGKACQLYLSVAEEHAGTEHNHEILAKLDYKLHGETLSDTEVVFKKYDIDSNTYSDADSKDSNSKPALASATLKDEDTDVDFNKLLQYEQSGELVQSMRIDFSDVNHDSFTTALETVIEDSSLLEANKPTLNNIERVVGKISHNGHYDGLACLGFQLTEVKSIEYVIGEDHHDDNHDDHDDHEDDEHDDHDDHEDEHDHDHDHDHGAH